MEPEIPQNLKWYSTNRSKTFTLESPVRYSILKENNTLFLRVGILRSTLKEIGWSDVEKIDVAFYDKYLFIARDKGAKLLKTGSTNRVYIHIPALKVFPIEKEIDEINMIDAVEVYHNKEKNILIVELR